MNGQNELEEAHDIADQRYDRIEHLKDNHAVADVLGEAEAVKEVDLVVIDVIEQVVLEHVSALSGNAICQSDVQL